MRSLADLASVLRLTARKMRDIGALVSEYGVEGDGFARVADEVEVAAGWIERGEIVEITDAAWSIAQAARLDTLDGLMHMAEQGVTLDYIALSELRDDVARATVPVDEFREPE